MRYFKMPINKINELLVAFGQGVLKELQYFLKQDNNNGFNHSFTEIIKVLFNIKLKDNIVYEICENLKWLILDSRMLLNAEKKLLTIIKTLALHCGVDYEWT